MGSCQRSPMDFMTLSAAAITKLICCDAVANISGKKASNDRVEF